MKKNELTEAVEKWSETKGIYFQRETGSDRFFAYVSIGDDCFQIVIEEQEGLDVTINIWDIETVEDEEFHESWTGSVDSIASGLSTALQKIRGWVHRRS